MGQNSPSRPPRDSREASGSFPMSQLFTSGGQSIGASPSASVLPGQDDTALATTPQPSNPTQLIPVVFSLLIPPTQRQSPVCYSRLLPLPSSNDKESTITPI